MVIRKIMFSDKEMLRIAVILYSAIKIWMTLVNMRLILLKSYYPN